MVIDDILKESREYYLVRKRSLVGFLLGVPRGSIQRKIIGGSRYCYLHSRDGARTVDVYIGKEEDQAVDLLEEKLAMRSRFLDEVRVARNALKSISIPFEPSISTLLSRLPATDPKRTWGRSSKASASSRTSAPTAP